MKNAFEKIENCLYRNSEPEPILRQEFADTLLCRLSGFTLYPNSLAGIQRHGMLMAGFAEGRRRLINVRRYGQEPPAFPVYPVADISAHDLRISVYDAGDDLVRYLPPMIPWCRPRICLSRPSLGLGDRTGLATPGHIRSVEGTQFFPYLAQQSFREMERLNRTPSQVLMDATWGVFREGYKTGFGADADHIRTIEQIELAASAGFTSFTLDLSEHINQEVHTLDKTQLNRAYGKLLKKTDLAEKWRHRYLGKQFTIPRLAKSHQPILINEKTFLLTVVKWGNALLYALKMAKIVQETTRGKPFELEISVDETDSPTTAAEHIFVALEMAENDFQISSLAPRFIGEFQKAIDFKGSLKKLARNIALHAAIARSTTNHAISVHTGSDKFSVYPIIAQETGGNFHIKTSGTSFLEGLRVVARKKPRLFRQIVSVAKKNFAAERSSYLIDASADYMPDPKLTPIEQLEETFLNDPNARQVLHVSYGPILRRGAFQSLGQKVFELLLQEEELYFQLLQQHIGKHIAAMTG